MTAEAYYHYGNTVFWIRRQSGRWEIFETINGDGCGTSVMLGTATDFGGVRLFLETVVDARSKKRAGNAGFQNSVSGPAVTESASHVWRRIR